MSRMHAVVPISPACSSDLVDPVTDMGNELDQLKGNFQSKYRNRCTCFNWRCCLAPWLRWSSLVLTASMFVRSMRHGMHIVRPPEPGSTLKIEQDLSLRKDPMGTLNITIVVHDKLEK
jgi:hypothetical protein